MNFIIFSSGYRLQYSQFQYINIEDDTTAHCYFAMGNMQSSNRIGEVVESFKRVLVITLKLHGEQHETTVNIYFEIVATQRMMGNYTSALEFNTSITCT